MSADEKKVFFQFLEDCGIPRLMDQNPEIQCVAIHPIENSSNSFTESLNNVLNQTSTFFRPLLNTEERDQLYKFASFQQYSKNIFVLLLITFKTNFENQHQHLFQDEILQSISKHVCVIPMASWTDMNDSN